MNRKLLFALLVTCFCAVTARAQDTLDAANFNPIIGDQFVNIPCDTTGVTQGASGAGITWNFTTLVPTAYDTGAAEACSATPDCAMFPGSSYATVSHSTDILDYYIETSTSLSQNGFYASADSNAVYSMPIVQFQYPFTYSTTFSNPYAGTITLGAGFTAQETGTITVTCDGYGVLQLPLGITDSNVLRAHTSQIFVDSTNLFGVTTGASFDLETYAWYKANYHNALMTILTVTQIGGGYTNKIVSVSPEQTYNLGTPAIAAAKATLRLYPNPVADDQLHLQFSTPIAQQTRITLSDLLGRTISTISDQMMQGTQNITFNTAAMPRGLYLLHVVSGGTTITRKVEIQ